MTKLPSMHFGIMCTGTVFQKWQADAVLDLLKNGHRAQLLIIDDRRVEKSSGVRRILKKKWRTFLFNTLENRIFKPAAKQPVDLKSELQHIESICCHVNIKGYSEYFDEPDILTIRKFNLDFILRFGFNIIRGNILSAARYGVWSFHHDDEMTYRGGPAGFWEIYKGDRVSGAIMQRLTDKLDGGIILKKGYLKTSLHSYRENLGQLLSVSSSWPAMVANTIAKKHGETTVEGVLPVLPPSKTSAPLYKVPDNMQMLKFLWILFRNRIRFFYRNRVTAEIWNIGLVKKPLRELALEKEVLQDADITWLPEVPRTRYLADPSGFMEEGRLHILSEDYSYTKKKAGILETVCELDPFRFGIPGSVLGGSLHMSYPFILEHDGKVYCIPESYQSSQITLYRREKPGGTFVRERVLLDDVAAVDPTLFFYHERWWLFFTSRKNSNTHLFIYHSPDLAGEFHAHAQNPVKTDIRSSRPAGTPFFDRDQLYRPAQDCSVTYGGRIAINRVAKLSADDFFEETVHFIEPVKDSRYNQGLHTLSGVGNLTLIDGKRYQVNPLFSGWSIWKKQNRKGFGHV
jgi:hypothetical protein